MKQIFCPLCEKEMYIKTCSKNTVRYELLESFSRNSEVFEFEEITNINMGCGCGSVLSFNDKNYDICFNISEEDKKIEEYLFDFSTQQKYNKQKRIFFKNKYSGVKNDTDNN